MRAKLPNQTTRRMEMFIVSALLRRGGLFFLCPAGYFGQTQGFLIIFQCVGPFYAALAILVVEPSCAGPFDVDFLKSAEWCHFILSLPMRECSTRSVFHLCTVFGDITRWTDQRHTFLFCFEPPYGRVLSFYFERAHAIDSSSQNVII